MLIKKGGDMNAKSNKKGETPLHWATSRGHGEVAELLIASGADMNAMEKNGETSLEVAENPEIGGLFRKHGAKAGEELKVAGVK